MIIIIIIVVNFIFIYVYIYLFENMVKPREMPSPLALTGTTVHAETLYMKWQNKNKILNVKKSYTALEIYISGYRTGVKLICTDRSQGRLP